MFNGGYDYVVVKSGRKVGAEALHPLYKPNGEFNDEAFKNTVNIPWSAYGIQVENSYNKPKGQRLGSQPTKIVTSDMYSNGVAVSPEAEAAVKEHTEALEALYENGFDTLLNDLGIIDAGDEFIIEDKSILATTLRNEMLKQEMSENALASITINPITKEFEIPFEASTNYIQIKRIIYSMVEKRIYSPTMNGNSAVQVPVTMWEASGKGRSLVQKIGKNTYKPITKEAYEKLSDEDKADVVYTDDTLKFYEDAEGLRHSEILIPFPTHLQGLFDNKFPKMGEKEKMAEILKYLNKNAEQSLFGIGFRIPTDALHSMERFKIAGFLPSFMGNTVVVPSAITTKSGSDFDIDKLNMYLRSMYLDSDGEIKIFELKGSEEETKEYYGQVFDRLIQNKQDNIIEQLLRDSEVIDNEREQTLNDKLTKLDEEKATREKFERKAYRRALENRYYNAIDNILSMEDNFQRLISVTTTDDLIEISEEMDELRNDNEYDIINRVLDRNYMTGQRQAFVMGKAWVGIVAQHITGHSNGQKAGLYVNDEKFTMSLPHNTLGKYVSVSGLYDSDGNYISANLSQYMNAIVDIAKDPYIMKLIYSGQVVDIVMFLARAGVSPRNAALFLSQPIIRSFVEGADNNNKKISSLFSNSEVVSQQYDSFGTSYVAKQAAGDKFDMSQLTDAIKDYTADQTSLTDKQNAQQQLIFKEFIQIARATNGLTEITQSTNFDTTSFRSAEQLSRKQLKVEQQGLDPDVIPISSSVAVLENTHIGKLEEFLDLSNIALGTIFKFNTIEFREFIDSMINKFGINKYLSKDKYNKISEQLSASLLDYIIQSNTNMFVKELTSGPNSIAVKLEKARAANPNLQILQDLQIVPGKSKNAPSTVKLSVSKLDAAEENMYANMMRGLRDEASTRDLYNDLVKLSIVQGTYRTAASIKNIIPIEDYARMVTDSVKNANVDDSVKRFKQYAFFQRNNFRDVNITPQVTLKGIDLEKESTIDEFTGDIINKYSFPSIINEKLGRTVLRINKQFTKVAGAELIVIPAVLDIAGDKVNFQTGKSITPSDFARAATQDDNPYKYMYGYQLVKNTLTGQPLMIQTNPRYAPDYVYKIVNLYGDGRFTTEYPGFPVKSELENGTIKVTQEYTDDEVLALLKGQEIRQSVAETPVVEAPTAIDTTPEVEPTVSSIQQNFADGQGGRKMQPQFAGKSTMDLILSGDRTRTTRAQTDINRMINDYGLTKIEDLVGKIIPMTDKSGRVAQTRIIKVAPFTKEYQDATWQKEGWEKSVTDKLVGQYPYGIEFELVEPGQISTTSVEPKGQKVKEGIYVNQQALTKDEQIELFNYLKPYLESQASKTNKGTNASKMIGLGLRWDYKVNNPGKEAKNIPDVINPANKNKYGYYDTSINDQPLAPISDRFKELMEKATGVDMTNYDGAIINLYESNSFISSHNDVDESRSAIGYPVIGVNLGGTGNFAIESRDGDPKNLLLKDGTGYVFGVDGVNREVFHRTFPTPQDSFLPALTTQLDGKTYEPGSYRVTITMRRVMPLEPGMPTKPVIKTTQQTPAQPVTSPKTINIYAGTGENSELSNFANRPFEDKTEWKGLTFKSVEGAYQAAKIQLSDMFDKDDNLTKEGDVLLDKLQEASGAEAKALGRKVTGLNVREWDRVSSKVMKGLLLESFKQNPDALAKLLATGDAVLTHTQDKGNWGTEFPKLLMEVRSELRPNATSVTEKPIVNTVEYGGKKFIVEGTPDGGNLEVFFTKIDGSKGAELTSDKPLYRKVIVAFFAQNRPQDVVELTELQGSPKYLTTMDGRIVSLNPTSYGDVITSSDVISRVQAKLKEKENNALESLTPEDITSEVGEAKSMFSYKGTTIETAFDLTEGQTNALQELADFVQDNKDKFITLQGPAGTGKTSVIGYLQNYLGGKYNFIYMAPTHAATAELAFATVKTGNKTLPMTVASGFSTRSIGGRVVKAMTRKLLKKLALRNNVIVIDEVSMLNSATLDIVKGAIGSEDVKIIFMGDISQIPEVDQRNPATKQVSRAFNEFNQVKLTEVKRTSDNDILEVLTAVRNNINNKIPKVDNTDALRYLKVTDFNRQLAESVEKNPEETMLIAYTNSAVSEYNKKIRQELGRTGDLQKDDVIMGYLGYSSKQIEKGDIANSIQYTIKNIQKYDSVYRITATSKKLDNLREKGVQQIYENSTTGYYQLSPNDVFTFSDITSADMITNNNKVSELMKAIYDAKTKAIASGSSRDWVNFYEIVELVSQAMSKIDLGRDYIYDPSTNKMERYSADKYFQFKKDFAEVYVEKGIDLGHALTIHKSQGSTIKNVFFDANSLPKGSSSKLYNGDTLIGTEKQSLIYVGMSRTSNLLAISDDISENFYNLKTYDPSQNLSGQSVNEQSYRLADNKIYKASEITVELMEKMGYSNDIIGQFFKKLNGC